MKKFLALLSAMAMIFSLCACTADNPENTVNSPDPTAGESATVSPTDTVQEPSLALPGGEPSEEVPEEPSQAPETQAPETQAPETQAPATQAPETQAPVTQTPATQAPETQAPATQPPATQPPETQAPDPSPTLPGGGIVIPGLGGLGGLGGGGTTNPPSPPSQSPGEVYEPDGPSVSDTDMTGFYNFMMNSGDYVFPDMNEAPSTEWISSYIPGLVNIPAVQRLVFIPRATSNGVEIVLVQVKNSDHVSAVKSILQAHIDYKSTDFNYPQVMEAWQINSRVVSQGNYIMLIVHSEYEAIIADFNAFFE